MHKGFIVLCVLYVHRISNNFYTIWLMTFPKIETIDQYNFYCALLAWMCFEISENKSVVEAKEKLTTRIEQYDETHHKIPYEQ